MAWPLYVAGAAALGGLGYWLWPSEDKHHKHSKKGDDGSEQPPDLGAGDTQPAPASDAEESATPVTVPGSTAPNQPATTGFHPGPFIMPQAADATRLRGHGREAAKRLHAWLSANGAPLGYSREVLAFQRSHNSDPLAIRLAGRLPRTGHYDARTAATLTMYTGNPLAPHPDAPRPPAPPFEHVVNPNIPGLAAMAGYNLGTDLRNRGLVHDERQRELIREYQRQINRDPKFPGPAWTRNTRPVFRQRVKENGRYTPQVAHALSLQTHGAPEAPRV
jgi:hypothetical protein